MPPSITDRTPREGDEQFITIKGRRPTIEYAVASVAERLIPVRRGVSVVGLLTGPSAVKGIPHVTGVLTMDGEEYLPTSSSTRWDDVRSYRTGWRLSELAV
jgi:hypothetical protein